MKITDLILYKEYKLSEIAEAFENGSFIYGGGMIYTVKNNTLVLISKHTPDAIYKDEPKNGKYIYTGMGQTGDQTITLGNKRLINAKRDNTGVYLFVTYAPNKFEYYGRVELNDPYYYDLEEDIKDHRVTIAHTDALEIAEEFGNMMKAHFGDDLKIEYEVVKLVRSTYRD